MHSDQRTALSGTFKRRHKNIWARSDHSPAPGVHELTPTKYYNFRIRSRRCIEVPVLAARDNQNLHWITTARYEISLSGYQCGPIVIHADGHMTRASQTGKAIPEFGPDFSLAFPGPLRCNTAATQRSPSHPRESAVNWQ